MYFLVPRCAPGAGTCALLLYAVPEGLLSLEGSLDSRRIGQADEFVDGQTQGLHFVLISGTAEHQVELAFSAGQREDLGLVGAYEQRDHRASIAARALVLVLL